MNDCIGLRIRLRASGRLQQLLLSENFGGLSGLGRMVE